MNSDQAEESRQQLKKTGEMEEWEPAIKPETNTSFQVMWGDVHMSAGTRGDQKRALDSWELELEAVVSNQTWVLGIEAGSSAIKANALNC